MRCNFSLFNLNIAGIYNIFIFIQAQSYSFLDFINDERVKEKPKENNDQNNQKIQELMEIIESLRKQITELEKQLNIEKDQNQNLLKELQDLKDKIKLIQDLENKLEEEKNKNKILKDKNEKKKKKIYKNIKGLLKGYDIKQEAIQKIISKLTGQNKDIIKVNFISTDQQINCSLECNKNEKFNKLENLLYKQYPQFNDPKTYFIVNGIKVEKDKTLEENKIKNNDTIMVNKVNTTMLQ